jgi:ABC-2 type transport system permease protein
MPLHNTQYQHWEGIHLGLWQRRGTIALNGLTACLQIKGMRHVVAMCWIAALGMTAALFLIGQLLVADSIVVQWVGNLNPQLQGFARTFTSWLEQHPEVSVRTTQNVLFYYFGTFLLPVSIFALGVVLPVLITRDLASNAIIIYASKAVSRGDYLLGKFCTAFGLLALTWLGPICAAWLLGNLLAPDWRFFWHSRVALFHTVIFGIGSMVILSLLALGVSALSSKEKSAPAVWFMWWIIGGVIAPIAAQTKPWLRHLSFNYNLDQLALSVFRLGDDLKIAQDNVPIFGTMLRNIRAETMAALNSPPVWGAVCGLLVMAGIAALVVVKRVKPE